jgi:Domain of unknown function (DUF4326)
MTTTVHNLCREPMRPGDIRIGRCTEFGNEFIVGCDGSRADVIARFEKSERARLADPGPAGEARRRKVHSMHGKRLFCWYAPEGIVKLACCRQRGSLSDITTSSNFYHAFFLVMQETSRPGYVYGPTATIEPEGFETENYTRHEPCPKCPGQASE